MDEYISREAAKQFFNLNFGSVSHAIIAARLLDEIPAADVVPIRNSRWIHCFQQDGETVGQCYECHAIRFIDPYCPNCGARMDGDG